MSRRRTFRIACWPVAVVLFCASQAAAQQACDGSAPAANPVQQVIDGLQQNEQRENQAQGNDGEAAPEAGRGRRGGRGGGQGRGGRRGRGGGGAPANEPVTRTTDLMLNEFHVDDPFLLPVPSEGTYYLFAAGRDDRQRAGVVAYTSPDLKIWAGPKAVFTVPDGIWANPRDGARAPEVHQHNGKYYLLVTLNNRDAVFAEPPAVWRVNHLRGTVIAMADSPLGPYELLGGDGPVPPRDFMTLDGTLYVDPQGKPWMVYCHDWVQVIDGTIEAVPLADDLSASTADPVHLFKASDGPWLAQPPRVTRDERSYPAEGVQMVRTRDGQLLAMWSSHTIEEGYIQAVARSRTGELTGPWEQLGKLVGNESGHGMLLRSFDDQLLLAIQQPFGINARTQLYEIEDGGDRLVLGRRREDLDTRAGAASNARGGGGRGRGGRGAAPPEDDDGGDQ